MQGPRPLSLGRPRPGGGGGQSSPPGARAASGVGLTGLLTTRCKEPTWEPGRGHGSGTWLHVGSVRGDARALPSMGPADHPRAEVSSFPSDGALGSGAVSPSGTWHRASGCRACSPVRKDRPSAFSAGPEGVKGFGAAPGGADTHPSSGSAVAGDSALPCPELSGRVRPLTARAPGVSVTAPAVTAPVAWDPPRASPSPIWNRLAGLAVSSCTKRCPMDASLTV